MNQATSAPTNKVAAGAVAGALSVIVVWLVGMTGIVVPPEVASALTVIMAFIAGYIVQEKATEPMEVTVVKETKK